MYLGILIRGKMDITTISCGRATRDRIQEYRDERGLSNYDAALQDLLQEVDVDA